MAGVAIKSERSDLIEKIMKKCNRSVSFAKSLAIYCNQIREICGFDYTTKQILLEIPIKDLREIGDAA